jgi:hypothetical protein
MCPLRCVWVAPAEAGVKLKKKLTVTHHFFASDYTRHAARLCLEICIRQIHFSDSLRGKLEASRRPSPVSVSSPGVAPTILFEAILASRGCHRIMHRGCKPGVPVAWEDGRWRNRNNGVFEPSTL